jgi:hypothetical protein
MADTGYFPLPLSVEEITIDWLTAALRQRAASAGVLGFKIIDMVDTTTTKIRRRLQLDEPAPRVGHRS